MGQLPFTRFVVPVAVWVLAGAVLAETFRNDFSPSMRQGCVWSVTPLSQIGNRSRAIGTSPVVSSSDGKSGVGYSLDCNVRTLNVDFWNYTFNREQLEETRSVRIKCNDKLYFESYLAHNQTLFRLANLEEVSIESCKIRRVSGRLWASLGFLKSLSLQTQNGDWASSVTLEVDDGGFEGLSRLTNLDLSQNNIWSLSHRNVFCPLKSLLKLNLSRNRLSDIEELLSLSRPEVEASQGNGNGYYCALPLQSLDLSQNSLRRLGKNAFTRTKRLVELKLQNNFLEELEDSAFSSLTQLKLVNLSSNRLVALPPSIFRQSVNLREVYLSNNSISALSPQVFSGLDSLLLLDLSRNTLTSQWIKENMFYKLHRLILLRLSFNQLSYVDSTIFQDLISLQALHLDNNRLESVHPQAFSSLSNLHILDLSHNRLTTVDSRMLANLFVLRQLYLDHNKIRSVDPDALRNCSSLQDLGLADNLLQEVPTALRASLAHLVTLDIGENRIGTVSNESFAGLDQLYGLRMVDNRITELPHSFCDSLKNLRVLNLAQNRISQVSSSAFVACPKLRALRLDTNALTELPSTLAPQLPSLLWLNVSVNRLRWADYHELPPTIEWLDLSYNALETLGGPVTVVNDENSSGKKPISYSLRVLDASHNLLTSLDYTTIPATLETLRLNHNRLKTVAPDTFIRSTRLRRVELMGNQLENIPLAALRFPPVPLDKPLPEFYLGGNSFICDCSMEWLTRVNQLTLLRQHPRVMDLDSITCHSTFSQPKQLISVTEALPKDFLCPYKSHCFALCHCCDFDACDCEMTCPGNCTCYHDTAWSANIVECSSGQHTQVPPRIPMDATEVYLDGNVIPQLTSHIFIGKKNLRVLWLNGSHVESIKNKTFNGLKSLEVLRLDQNRLEELYGHEFADLENLRELHLQNNLLQAISREAFVGLKFLQVLRLDGNFLVDFNVWELSGNGYLNSLMVSRNPWSCDCEFLIPFRTWVASKSAVVVDFALAKCQMVHNETNLSGQRLIQHHTDVGSTQNSDYSDPTTYAVQLPITSMCSGNKDTKLTFTTNVEEEINNHISAMGGAEKVAIPQPGSSHEVQFTAIEEDSNVLWTLGLTFSILVVLVFVVALIFRKEIYYWCYPRLLNDGLLALFGCCGGKIGKKSGTGVTNSDDTDKLFDAYFLYSKKDEDILLQKIIPELEQGSPAHRLCLHYRDLCLNADNPWNTDMILSACDASKRVIVLLSRTFLQTELTHAHFRMCLQSAINRHQKKLILILLPPFTEQNLATVYPELKGPGTVSSSSTASLKSNCLEWTDKNFWSKLKLLLPTPCATSHAGSLVNSAFPDATRFSGSATISRLDYPYSSQHQYHRNILPYQIPMTGSLSIDGTLPVPKHRIALSTPLWGQQTSHQYSSQNNNSNNNSQDNNSQNCAPQFTCSSQQQKSMVIPGVPSAVVHPMLQSVPNYFPFNESFRRHQQLLQQNSALLQGHYNPLEYNNGANPHLPITLTRSVIPMLQQNYSGSQYSSSGTTTVSQNNSTSSYRPLEQAYSSSAMSTSAEDFDHVYSTLDSPLQSPTVTSSANHLHQSVVNMKKSAESANNNAKPHPCNGNSSSFTTSQQEPTTVDNNVLHLRNGSTNMMGSTGGGGTFLPSAVSQPLSQNHSTNLPSNCQGSAASAESNHSGSPSTNNGRMYFV